MNRNHNYFGFRLFLLVLTGFGLSSGIAQQQPELQTALMKMGRVWSGVTANGGKGSFDYRAGFFPNDYNVLGIRGQDPDAWTGAGITLTATNWKDHYDSLHTVAVYGATNDSLPQGKVIVPITNFVRFSYPDQVVGFKTVPIEDFGTVDPGQFTHGTYDQIVEVTTENFIGVQLHRKVLAWTQNFHDDYMICDVELTNVSGDTLHDFYVNIKSNSDNAFRSNGSNPAPSSGEKFDPATTWQHYYGGRIGDSLRVFYEYSADDPREPGDDMGAPVTTQQGRLINATMSWYSILHASKEPYADPSRDEDDFLQPRVTYVGKDNLIPYNESGDEFGSKNFWAIRGGYGEYFPMSGDTWPGTFHAGNTDEQGSADYTAHPAGTYDSNNSKMWSSFGPYTFAPGQKIRLVWASGFSGLSLETAKTVGCQWLKGTLEEPEHLPDMTTGYFPANFVFPSGASEMDKRKDRWVSTGIDSVMQSASRAKWNFESGYRVPQAPPPPSMLEITGLGTGVEIKWADQEAEQMDNFAGYRIMRRISNSDTVIFEEIYSSDSDDIAAEHLYSDLNVLMGASYYYYLQAKARIDAHDPNAHPSSRGKIIYSSRALIPTIYDVNPPSFSQDDLSKIRIVPNPYNINDPLLEAQGWNDQRGIRFFNLPVQATIKIFTENGDLVQTLHHPPEGDNSKRGDYLWDMITRNEQVINSGVYIAVFETPAGGVSYQKFVVVR